MFQGLCLFQGLRLFQSLEYQQSTHCKPIPVMKAGFSLCSISNRKKPVFINWKPCNENRFFPVHTVARSSVSKIAVDEFRTHANFRAFFRSSEREQRMQKFWSLYRMSCLAVVEGRAIIITFISYFIFYDDFCHVVQKMSNNSLKSSFCKNST